jgi:hypothetical protein
MYHITPNPIPLIPFPLARGNDFRRGVSPLLDTSGGLTFFGGGRGYFYKRGVSPS